MIWLILGIALWWAAHFFKRLAPAQRSALTERMGDASRGIVALLVIVSIVLMVIGYRAMDYVPVYATPSWAVHLNNLLVLVAIFMMSPAPKRGKLLSGMRHPMLTGFALWAFAHLLVNGDLASVLLFGGLLVWAPLAILAINRAEPGWTPGPAGTYAKDAMFLGASVILLLVIGFIHGWIGPSPFPM